MLILLVQQKNSFLRRSFLKSGLSISDYALTLIDRDVFTSLAYALISRSHDPSAGDNLLDSVSTPARDSCTCKNRCKEFRRYAEH